MLFIFFLFAPQYPTKIQLFDSRPTEYPVLMACPAGYWMKYKTTTTKKTDKKNIKEPSSKNMNNNNNCFKSHRAINWEESNDKRNSNKNGTSELENVQMVTGNMYGEYGSTMKNDLMSVCATKIPHNCLTIDLTLYCRHPHINACTQRKQKHIIGAECKECLNWKQHTKMEMKKSRRVDTSKSRKREEEKKNRWRGWINYI